MTDCYNLCKGTDCKRGFRMGDPYAVAKAIQFIIEHDLAQHSIKLAPQTVATGTRIGGLSADL